MRRTSTEPVNMAVQYSGVDAVRMTLHQAGEQLVWVDLTRGKAKQWAEALNSAAETWDPSGRPLGEPLIGVTHRPKTTARMAWSYAAMFGLALPVVMLTAAQFAEVLPQWLSMRWQFWVMAFLILRDALGHLTGAIWPESSFLMIFFESTAQYQIFWAVHWLVVLALLAWVHFAGAL